MLTATLGEVGISGVEPEKAGAIRKQELLRAVEQLGIQVYFLGYQDGGLAGVDPEKLIEDIACWIDMIEPQVVLTFGPDGVSGHPDHVMVSKIVTEVVKTYFPKICLIYIAPSEATVLGCGVSSSSEAPAGPLLSVDISNYKVQKIRAILSHASQHPPLEGTTEEAVEKIPCHEYFAVAQTTKPADDLSDCFEVEVGCHLPSPSL